MCPKAVGCFGEKDGFFQPRQSGGGTRWRDGGAEEERAGPTSDDFSHPEVESSLRCHGGSTPILKGYSSDLIQVLWP